MANDGTVKIGAEVDESGFKSSLSKLGGVAKTALTGVTAAIGAASAAIGGVAAAAVKVGSSFEESMSQVAATMGITTAEIAAGSDEFELLSKAAKDAGATTAFSASEASQALNYLALAGYDAQKAADALPAVLNLAAAGSMDLAYASDLATDAMAALGIEASKESLTRFGDEMAKTASKANTSVSQLGEAILTVGGTAKSLAGGTVELNAALGVLANRGIKGAEGGTALRNLILSLSAPTDKAAKVMKDLGLEVYDTSGKMRPLNEVFKDLDKAMSTMTEGQKTQVLNEIFNKVDLKSAQALLAGCGEEFDNLALAIENSGGAMQDMADTQLDNLNGDITILKSGLEGLGISLYEEMQEPLRGGVQLITDFVSQLAEAMNDGGLESLVAKAGDILAQVLVELANQLPGFIDMGVQVIQSLIDGLVSNLPSLLESAGQIVSALINGITAILPQLVTAAAEIIKQLAQGFQQGLPELAAKIPEGLANAIDSLGEHLPEIAAFGVEVINSLVNGILEAIPAFIEALPQLIDSFTNFLVEAAPQILQGGVGIIKNLIDGIKEAIPAIAEALPDLIDSIVGFLVDALPQVLKVGAELVLVLIGGIISAIPELVAALPQIITAIGEGLLNLLGGMVDVGKAIVGAIWDGIVDGIKSFFGLDSGSSGGSSKSSTRGAPARMAAEPMALSDDEGGGLNTQAMTRARAVMALEGAIPEAQNRVAIATASMAPAAGYAAPPPATGGGSVWNGQTPNIIVRPNVVLKAEGDLAPLAQVFKPALDAENARVGVGVQ